jgi:CheY-like chemotaxis protein
MIGVASRRILVIEDEMLIALMLQSMLEALGYQVAGRARAVADALAIIATNTQGIDAATLDVNLGGEYSNAVADALKAHGIPFVITTGYDDLKILAEFHGRPVVQKPFVPGQLEQALQSLEPRR